MTGFPLTASLAPNSLTFTTGDGRTHLVTATHPRFAMLEAIVRVALVLQHGEDQRPYRMAVELLPQLATGSALPKTISLGSLQIGSQGVMDGAETVENQAADRALWAVENEVDPGPVLAFLNRLLANPSKRSVDDLFDYVDRHGLALTPDGFIVGYAQVGAEHAGPDTVVEVRRNRVEEDLSRPSPQSLNFGPFPHFVMEMRRAHLRVLAVLVDPADVVAVPTLGLDEVRCCRYRVIADCSPPADAAPAEEVDEPVAAPAGQPAGTEGADSADPPGEPAGASPAEGRLHFTALTEPPPEPLGRSNSLLSRMAGGRLS